MTVSGKQFYNGFSILPQLKGMLRAVFFLTLLFSGIALRAEEAGQVPEPPPLHSNHFTVDLLTVNRDCEAPVLRHRFGQQLQLGLRASRPGQPWNLQRNNEFEGKLLPEFRRQILTVLNKFSPAENQTSSYHIYSSYTLPVRAGPAYLHI